MSACGPFVWAGRVLEARCEWWRGLVLRFCIRPVSRAFIALGHHGYPRASVLILGKALVAIRGKTDVTLGLYLELCRVYSAFSPSVHVSPSVTDRAG